MKSETVNRAIDPIIIVLALINVSIHLFVIKNLEYHRDELLYFSLGQHPAFGYASVPPLIGWISWFMQNVFGYSVFAVRLFPALLSGIMVLLASLIARELGGSRFAGFLSGIGLTVSIFFMRSFTLFQPVHLEIFLWTLCIYMIIKYINTQKDKFLIFFGIITGFALLNKYLCILLFTGLIVVIPFTINREVFRKRAFWIGLMAGFLIFLPNLIWQVSKGFPVFNHFSELYDKQLVHMDIPLFLTEQLIMPFAGSVLTIAGLIFLLTDRRAGKFRFLGFVAVFVIGALLILKGKSYYTLGVFPLLIIAGAVAYDLWIKKLWIKMAIPLFIIMLTLPVVPIGLPVYNEEGLKRYFNMLDKEYGIDVGRRFEDGSVHSLPQDYADMLGWEELTEITNKAWQMIADKKAAFIYGENYGQAGAITVIGKKYGLPEALSFSESFQYWIPGEFNPDIKSIVYINDVPGKDVKAFFGKITLVGSISNPDAREYGTSVYLCEEPVGSFNDFWKARLNEPDVAQKN
jgi:hypothetical protein